MLPTNYDSRTRVDRKQVQEYFGISTNTVTKWIAMGKLPTPVPIGKKDYWRFVDILHAEERLINGVKLLVMGTVDVGGTGCVCPEHVMLKSILSTLTYRKNDVVIMDMEAGLEHLGRGTAANMDQFIVVIEPGARSVQTYRNVKRLADDLGVKRVRVVANKVRDQRDEEFVRNNIPAEDLLGMVHYNLEIMDADRNGQSPYDFSPTAIEEIRKIKEILDRD